MTRLMSSDWAGTGLTVRGLQARRGRIRVSRESQLANLICDGRTRFEYGICVTPRAVNPFPHLAGPQCEQAMGCCRPPGSNFQRASGSPMGPVGGIGGATRMRDAAGAGQHGFIWPGSGAWSPWGLTEDVVGGNEVH